MPAKEFQLVQENAERAWVQLAREMHHEVLPQREQVGLLGSQAPEVSEGCPETVQTRVQKWVGAEQGQADSRLRSSIRGVTSSTGGWYIGHWSPQLLRRHVRKSGWTTWSCRTGLLTKACQSPGKVSLYTTIRTDWVAVCST